MPEMRDLQEAVIRRVLQSHSRKKLLVAGPGTGKTTLFKRLLTASPGDPQRRLVLTFINSLKNDLVSELSDLARVFTLHSYCLRLLYRNASLRTDLSPNFRCWPGLATLIKEDWEIIKGRKAPHFVGEMRNLEGGNHISFYLERGKYYDAVDFDDSVYRVHNRLASGSASPKAYDLVLVDEYQDFNRLEAGFIELLSQRSPIVIAGDDDQALYCRLRDSSCEHIRSLGLSGDYQVFHLPFCMRCTKVIVDAVSDVITRAAELGKLQGRIPKPYEYFPPVKETDSDMYPTIAVVETSVQRQQANYMGRYIAQEIARIPSAELDEAASRGYPAALVIVANPYRRQIVDYLTQNGIDVRGRPEPPNSLDRDHGLSILKEEPDSNLGWRIVLRTEAPDGFPDAIAQTANGKRRLSEAIAEDLRKRILSAVDAYAPQGTESEEEEEPSEPSAGQPTLVASFEGAKGLSAQHVFIAGLHDGEMPRNPGAIDDLEICKFIVGLTRTRKKCSLIYTHHFADKWKSPSTFISWIDHARLERVKVDSAYWSRQPG